MVDLAKVLEVLRGARALVERDWGNTNPRVPAHGTTCASLGITQACRYDDKPVMDQAHLLFLRAAGLDAPSNSDARRYVVFRFNDAQTSIGPVLAAFDHAIATLEAELEPTPNADAALNVMDACHAAGEVVARQIVATHPQMDLGEITALASAELFYAAQDTARVCSVSEGLGKLAEIVQRATS